MTIAHAATPVLRRTSGFRHPWRHPPGVAIPNSSGTHRTAPELALLL